MTEIEGKKLYSRLYKRLNASKEAKEFYEAHQLYRILYNRLNDKNEKETEDLLLEGASFLVKEGQHESGADLMVLLLKYYVKRSKMTDEAVVVRVKDCWGQMKGESEERSAVSLWMERASEGPVKELWHHWLAALLWKEGDLCSARRHFVFSGHGAHTALLLISLHRAQGYPSECDLFLLQAVLQLLCLQKPSSANTAFVVYLRHHPSILRGPPFKVTPIFNFLWLLLLAVDAGLSAAAFKALCDHYNKHLNRDDSYTDYLTRIGQLYFNIAPSSNNENFLSNIMNMFMKDDSETRFIESHFTAEEMD